MLEKLKQFLNKLNQQGIPIPLLKDPKTSVASVSFSLLVLSSLIVVIGLLGKMAKFFGGVDITQSIYWWGGCAALYANRTWNVTGKDENAVEETKSEVKETVTNE